LSDLPLPDTTWKALAAVRVGNDEQADGEREVLRAPDTEKVAQQAVDQNPTVVYPELARSAPVALSYDAFSVSVATSSSSIWPPVIQPAPEQIRNAQLDLRRLGCFVGRADGQIDRSTQDAVKDYWFHTGQAITEVTITEELVMNLHQHQGHVCDPNHLIPIPIARPMRAPPRAKSPPTIRISKAPVSVAPVMGQW
jgi:hypothetical protein